MGSGSGGREKPKGKPFEKPFQLFNVADDPNESNNLIVSESDRAGNLNDLFNKLSHGDHEK